MISDLGLEPHQVAAAAYVGKAVLALLRNGLIATTIHSLIYITYAEIIRPAENAVDQRIKTKLKFKLKESLDEQTRLIIIDEATMVDDRMRDEILSFGIPTVFIGDKNQLPPIFGKSSVMDNPNFTLTKIMRQAEGDPIVYLSQRVLHDDPLLFGEYGKSSVVPLYKVDSSIIDDFDIVICGKNSTREEINNSIRNDVLGYTSKRPLIGDKIICRQNNWDYCVDGIYLTNGLIGYITDLDLSSLSRGYGKIDFRPDFMVNSFENVCIDYRYILADVAARLDYGVSEFNKFEYGYAITAHLSQGSEYDRVLFIDEPFWDKDTTKKLRYTAITRAKESIKIVKSLKKKFF
jgi:ATP-dependent exoDNAse (exonuclease V) alpha subunit